MVLRADPGVTLPGLILGSSINWCMAWGELLLSVFFPVCNGSIAGVPCSCYEDHLGYYKLFLRAGEPEARSSQLHMCWVTSKGCACSAVWNTVAKKVHLSYFDASVGSGLSRYGLLWSWGVRRSVCPGLRLPSAFLLQPGYISSGVAAWPLGVGADMAEPQAGQWGAALCPAKSLLLALAPPAPKAAPCAYHCSVCAWG